MTIPSSFSKVLAMWHKWWRKQSNARQDRFAFFGLAGIVAIFFLAVITSIVYLQYEETVREQSILIKDAQFAQQRLHFKLFDMQEQQILIARQLSNQSNLNIVNFKEIVNPWQGIFPSVNAVAWIDTEARIKAAIQTQQGEQQIQSLLSAFRKQSLKPSLSSDTNIKNLRPTNEQLQTKNTPAAPLFNQSVISEPYEGLDSNFYVLLHTPIFQNTEISGFFVMQVSLDGLLIRTLPKETKEKYTFALVDGNKNLLAGSNLPQLINPTEMPVDSSKYILSGIWSQLTQWWVKTHTAYEYFTPIPPTADSLFLRTQGYRTSFGLINNALFWLVCALSILTLWMIIATWRHTRKRLRAQQALINETNFRRALENAMLIGIRVLDMQGKITHVNAAFCQMTGWQEQEIIGQEPPFVFWPEKDHPHLMQRVKEELSGEIPSTGFQARIKRKNGTFFEARFYVSPLIDAQGKQTGWLSSLTDITEPNRIRAQLTAAHDRFTVVLESLDASVSVAPLGSNELVFANKLYRQWFHASDVDLENLSAQGHLDLVEQASQAGQAQSLYHLSKQTQEQDDNFDPLAGLPTNHLVNAQSNHVEIYASQLNKWLEVRSRYINWVDGRLAQMVIATDITERRKAQEQASLQMEKAQTASRLITMGEMASSVAHELNQPLTAISNYCTGMIARIHDKRMNEADLLLALEKTSKQALRAGQIIQRIRSFVKRSEPNRTPTHVQHIIDESLELVELELRKRNVRLKSYVAARMPMINVDPILIEQVLVNLIKNASESIDKANRSEADRYIELKVAPRFIEAQHVIEFSIQDRGTGLPPEVENRLYEAFFSTKAEGMGIGLNLCRSIVESHQGHIRAQNIYNDTQSEILGCRFNVWLPIDPSTANDFMFSNTILNSQFNNSS